MKNIPIIWKKTPDDDDTSKKTKMDEIDDLQQKLFQDFSQF